MKIQLNRFIIYIFIITKTQSYIKYCVFTRNCSYSCLKKMLNRELIVCDCLVTYCNSVTIEY